jgi:hypothetical protein
MHPELRAVFDKLPTPCPFVLVAGGAAVDFEKATDIDVWFPMQARGEALAFLHRFAVRVMTEGADQTPDDLTDGQVAHGWLAHRTENGYAAVPDEQPPFELLGTGWDPLVTSKPVQVLLHPHNPEQAESKPGLTPLDAMAKRLLRGFDITTHMWAVNCQGTVIAGAYATSQTEPADLGPNFWDAITPQMLSRLITISKRYGLPLSPVRLRAELNGISSSYTTPLVPTFDHLNGGQGVEGAGSAATSPSKSSSGGSLLIASSNGIWSAVPETLSFHGVPLQLSVSDTASLSLIQAHNLYVKNEPVPSTPLSSNAAAYEDAFLKTKSKQYAKELETVKKGMALDDDDSLF